MISEPVILNTPLTDSEISSLRAGDRVLLSGTIYTARDAAHLRLVEAIRAGKELPIKIAGSIIYYTGPAPAPPGRVIGPAGPTTSSRMDPYVIPLLEKGLKGTIGKGSRSEEVVAAMKKYRAVYFAATGGAAALIGQHIKKAKVVAYRELGAEAIRELEVENFPLIVINDIHGNDLYKETVKEYAQN